MYGNRLRSLRERIGLTQSEVAEKINIKKSQYCIYEKEKATIPLKHLNTLCNFYKVSLDYIFGFTNIKKYKNTKSEIDLKKTSIRLKEFRKNNKLTQNDLAELLNTSRTTITEYERERFLIATAFLYQICIKYKISADYMIGKIDNKAKID